MPFRVVLADSLYIISSLPTSVNTFFHFFDIFLIFSLEQSVRLTHTLARERIAQLYIPLRELRFLARSAFLCNREFQRNFLLQKKHLSSLRCSSRGTRIRTRTSGFGDRYSTIKLYPYITIVINLKYHAPSKLHIIKHSAF